ncbi:MAG: hypothetical protein ABIO78_06240, partial [Thermoanaerobaculia bacterium]
DEPLFARPYGVAWDGDAIVVTDPGAGRVVRIDPTGRVVLSPVIDDGEPIGVAVCQGRILVTDARLGRVDELDRNLRRVAVIAEGLERPTGVACNSDLAVIAETGAHRLIAIARDGTRRAIGSRGSGIGEFNFPISVAIRGGQIYAGDSMNFRIQRGDLATGKFTSSFGALGDGHGELPRLKGIAIDEGGNLWVTDAHLDEIAAYGADGRYLASVAGPGGDAGRFSFPAGIAISAKGSIAIADSLNGRVLVFATRSEGSR